MYSRTVLDHFMSPRNVGELAGHHGVGRVKSRTCLDLVEVTVRIGAGGVLTTAFRAQACSAAIAAASLLTEWVNGEALVEERARAIDGPSLAARLGGVPPAKKTCVALAPAALARALDDARRRVTGQDA